MDGTCPHIFGKRQASRGARSAVSATRPVSPTPPSTAARLPLADEAAALLQGAKNTVYAHCGTTTAKERLRGGLRGRSDAAKALHPKLAKVTFL